jgi:hypothetical protein
MTTDKPLESLGHLRRPEPGPFFAARVVARTTAANGARRTPWFLRVYWLALLVAASRMMVASPIGLAMAAVAATIIAFPAGSLALVLRTLGVLVRE